MKKYLMLSFAIFLIALISCEEKVDIEKEKEAIKAVFEQEKAAFFNQDYGAMGEFWIKEPSSMKYWLGPKGPNKIVGWDNINVSQKKETENNNWDRKQVKATHSNFQIKIMDESAWIFCETNCDGIFGGDTLKLKQNRIVVMQKVDGKWKFALHAIFQIPDVPVTNQ